MHLIGIIGRQGSGKTALMSMFAHYLSQKTTLPIYANYKSLQAASYVNTVSQIKALSEGILCLDELQTSMDSRLFKDNTELTYFVDQLRKRKLITLFTTQKFGKVDLRVRDQTDLVIECTKQKSGHQFVFLDLYSNTVGRILRIADLEPAYGLYDTEEVIERIKIN